VLGGLDTGSERDRAEQLVRARLRRENLDDDQPRVARRLVAMLGRRGYDPNMAYEVVRAQLSLELERRRT
jgi:regulatory protein